MQNLPPFPTLQQPPGTRSSHTDPRYPVSGFPQKLTFRMGHRCLTPDPIQMGLVSIPPLGRGAEGEGVKLWEAASLKELEEQRPQAPFCPRLPPLDLGSRFSAVLPSFPGGRQHRSKTQSKGRDVVGDQLPSVPCAGVSTGCPHPASFSSTQLSGPAAGRDTPASAPSHLSFLLGGAFGRKHQQGGNEPLRGFQSRAKAGVSQKKEGLGEGDGHGLRDGQRPAFLLSSPAAPAPGLRLGGDLLTRSTVPLQGPSPPPAQAPHSSFSHFLPVACGESQTDPALMLTSCRTPGHCLTLCASVSSPIMGPWHTPGSFLLPPSHDGSPEPSGPAP